MEESADKCPFWEGRVAIPPCASKEQERMVVDSIFAELEHQAQHAPPGWETDTWKQWWVVEPDNCPYAIYKYSGGHPPDICSRDCSNCSTPFRCCSAHIERYAPCIGWECLVLD